MNRLYLEPTEYTPGIIFDPQIMRFEMWGKSRPEDLAEFYFPLTEWWNNFFEEVKNKGLQTDSKKIVLDINIDYYNSASSKMIYDIINIGKNFKEHNIEYQVNWHFFEDDEDIYDSAQELAKELDMKFNMIKIEN